MGSTTINAAQKPGNSINSGNKIKAGDKLVSKSRKRSNPRQEQQQTSAKSIDETFSPRVRENIQWIETFCLIPEGKDVGKPVRLTDAQKMWINHIYGSPTRTFICSMARKNAKTSFTAFLLLLHLCGYESKQNAQLYSAAQSRDQAAILFALAAKIVRLSPALSKIVLIKESGKELHCPTTGSRYKALSADAATAYGLSPTFIVHDELGQVKGSRSELYEALETASAAQESPLSIVISTQAPTDADLLSLLIDDALKGSDPRTKIALHTAPLDLDPFSEEALREANPHYDIFMNKDEVRSQAEAARRMPSREAGYRNLILNQRISQTSPFVPRAIWMACGDEIDHSAFYEGDVYAGLDLSARNDLTALALIAKGKDGVWNVKIETFAPQIGVDDRSLRDRTPYDLWAKQGYIELTPGSSVSYEAVALRLCELSDEYQIRTISYDRWRMDILKNELQRLGRELPLEPFGQGFVSMAPALDLVESELLNKNIRHGMNPVLNWAASNAIASKDPAGNRKLDKSKTTGRIDPMVALAMAFGCLTKLNEAPPADWDQIVNFKWN